MIEPKAIPVVLMGPSGSPHRLGFYTSLGEDGRRQGSRSRGVLHVVCCMSERQTVLVMTETVLSCIADGSAEAV